MRRALRMWISALSCGACRRKPPVVECRSSIACDRAKPFDMKKALVIVSPIVCLAAIVTLSGGCSSPIPNRNPVGEAFPPVEAEPLDADSEG